MAGLKWFDSPRRGPLRSHRTAETMRLRLEKITSTPSGLVCGVQIRGPKDTWLRFAILTIPFDQIPATVLDDYWRWTDREERDVQRDEALPLNWA